MSPRTVKGQDWWDVTRRTAYASTDYHCLACGIHKTENRYHKWLEAHEDYDINFKTGEVNIKQIIPLCHSCHNFIHSGRLQMANLVHYGARSNNLGKIRDIIEHGIRICEENNLAVQYYTVDLADNLKISHKCEKLEQPDGDPDWGAWHLLLEGEKYYSKFKDINEWHNYYKQLNKHK